MAVRTSLGQRIGQYLKLWRCPPSAPVLSERSSSTESDIKVKWLDDAKPVVLILPWVNASSSALERYCRLYHDYGLDVITVNIYVKHFLWPPLAKHVTDELTRYFKSEQETRHILVHSFSIGSYLYSVWLSHILENSQSLIHFQEKICGQVFDSITIGGLARMAEGVGRGFSKTPLLQKVIKQTLLTYFAVTKNTTVKMYDKYIHAFEENPIKSPILFYYSWNDPMSDAAEVEKVISLLQKDNARVMKKDWQTSKHAGHFKEHTDEYVRAFDKYMQSVATNINHGIMKSKL